MQLGTESVEGLALALESVDHVERGDGLAARVLTVGDGILDDVAEEGLEVGAGLLIHEAGDALDATTASQTTDRRLRDAVDVVAEDLAMALGAALTTLATSGHDVQCGRSFPLKVQSNCSNLLTLLFTIQGPRFDWCTTKIRFFMCHQYDDMVGARKATLTTDHQSC